MMVNRQLTPKMILEKDFKTSMRGYSPSEIDEFLDVVIQDYEAFMKEINNLKAENARLLSKIDEASKQQITSQPTASSQSNASATNFDILKRLSNLERHVFGSKLDQD